MHLVYHAFFRGPQIVALAIFGVEVRSKSNLSAKRVQRETSHDPASEFPPISETTQRPPKICRAKSTIQQTKKGVQRARELRRTITKRSHRDAHARASLSSTHTRRRQPHKSHPRPDGAALE
jgi:hypothetical protein